MTAKELADRCQKLGIKLREEHILDLWSQGIIRAHYITSDKKMRRKGLTQIGLVSDEYYYSDAREVDTETNAFKNNRRNYANLLSDFTPYFHEYTCYILHHFYQQINPNISRMSLIGNFKGYKKLLNTIYPWIRNNLKAAITGNYNRLNTIVSLAVMAEPYVYYKYFREFTMSKTFSERFPTREELHELIERYWDTIKGYYSPIIRNEAWDLIEGLCVSAERLEENTKVRVLLRLLDPAKCIKYDGKLGMAMLTQQMAEVIRRSIEQAQGIQLPEEDELGFWIYPQGAKKRRYGNDHLLDGDLNTEQQFLRLMGYSASLFLRWYGEGDTEFGAFNSVIDGLDFTPIDVINLGGSKAFAKNTKTLRADLLRDMRKNVFSLVSVDGDRSEVLKILKIAIENQGIGGAVLISDPDFEFGNFTHDDLENIIWDHAQKCGVSTNMRPLLHDAIQHANSGEGLKYLAEKALNYHIKGFIKTQEWGKQLMKYATDNGGELHPLNLAMKIAFWNRHGPIFLDEDQHCLLFINGERVAKEDTIKRLDDLISRDQRLSQ